MAEDAKYRRAGRLLIVPGFRASGIYAGIKKPGKGKDLALILSDVPAVVAGVFTTNKVKAAPVVLDMERVKKGAHARGVVVNSGNANVSRGKTGYRDALRMASSIEKALKLKTGQMLVASTGVIGVPFSIEKIEAAAHPLIAGLSPGGLAEAARAIMTTDAFPKTASMRVNVNGALVTVSGIAKGAGMICPDMATMLAFIVTDADIRRPALSMALKTAVSGSFNSITVDNDTSTNDTVLVFANGLSNCNEIRSGTPGYGAFLKALSSVSMELARLIVKDGEGATRFIEIEVKGARTGSDAKKAARTIAESMLVKTAFFGGDPNWGRIMAALGRAGVKLNQEKVDITLNNVVVAERGIDTGRERQAAKALKSKEVKARIDLHLGKGGARVWTTDLTYGYVKINSAYRT